MPGKEKHHEYMSTYSFSQWVYIYGYTKGLFLLTSYVVLDYNCE